MKRPALHISALGLLSSHLSALTTTDVTSSPCHSSLAHLFSSLPAGNVAGGADWEVKLGPSQPWEAIMAKAQTQIVQVCQRDFFSHLPPLPR